MKVKRILIPKEALIDMLTNGYHAPYGIINGIPKGAIPHGMSFDYNTDCFSLMVGDSSYEDIPEGAIIPLLKPEVRLI